jgi:hypothetical protein
VHIPEAFTLCRATIDPDVREEMWERSVERDRERLVVGSGRTWFIAALGYDADCTEAPEDASPPIVMEGPASLDEFTALRRVEVAVKVAEWGCLSSREALALAVATAERLGGTWQVDAPGDDRPRLRPCAGLGLDQAWGTIGVWGGAYWDRAVPVPVELDPDDPRIDGDARARLEAALRSGDTDAVELDRVAAPTGLGHPELSGIDHPPSAEARALVDSVASLGCLAPVSAVTLASAVGAVLDELDPDAGWYLGEIREEELTRDGPVDTPATCYEVQFVNTDGLDETRPAVVVTPAWTD